MKTAAVIGCGRPRTAQSGKEGWAIGYAHGDGYLNAFPGVALYAVEPNPENLAAFAARFGVPPDRQFASTQSLYKAIIPDAVSVCTWPTLHVPQAREAIAHGVRAVTIEKPIGLDGFEIVELMQFASAKNARVAVAHQRRYEPAFVAARDLIASGALGQRLVIDARVGDDWDILSWTVHWFDMASYLFGDVRARSVLAGVDHTGTRRYEQAVENASTVFVDFGPDRQASFVTGPAALPNFGITIRGERGMLVIESPLKLWTTDGYRTIDPGPGMPGGANAALFADLWFSVGHDDRISRCDIRNCADATLLAYAAHESARTQKRITLPTHVAFAPLEVLQHPPEPASQAMRIAILSDPHHTWPEVEMSGQVGLREACEALGHHVTVLDATQDLLPTALEGAHVLVLYHTQQTTRASHRVAIGAWLAAGKVTIVSHCGIGAYADWPEFRQVIGRYWVWGGEPMPPSRHPHVPVTLHVEDDRFAVPWGRAWLPTDEMYQALGEASPCRDLVTAIAPDGHRQPFAWQVVGHPHVVAWLPGHRRDMFALPVVRDGLAAAIRLALDSGAR